METVESNLLRRQETDSRKKFPGQLWVRGFTGALGWRCEKQGGDRVAAATEVGDTDTGCCFSWGGLRGLEGWGKHIQRISWLLQTGWQTPDPRGSWGRGVCVIYGD